MVNPRLDCLYFNGYMPCNFHKKHGVHCKECKFYKKSGKNILIIKLQAAGEVIRNTPLLRKLNKVYPTARIFWLTKYPELVPIEHVYKVLDWDKDAVPFLLDQEFDILFNLDKDLEACSLANLICSKSKKGFTQNNGVIMPFDKDARHKWLTGVFDDLMKANKKNYIEEIFEVCGFKWSGEKYILPAYEIPDVEISKNRKIIGINTSVGKKWPIRKFSNKKLLSVIRKIQNKYQVVLLGGPDEHSLNMKIASMTKAAYFGVFPIKKFIGLVSLCDLVVTPVTMAMHIAIGLEKKIIILNSIFPRAEFYLYGLGDILEPDISCKYCYKSRFDSNCQESNLVCMDLISNKDLLSTIKNLLNNDR